MVGVPGKLLALLGVAALAACGGDDGDLGADCAGAYAPGELVITEVMADPADGVEYIEVFNPGAAPADLIGLAVVAGDTSHEIGPVLIEAGGYFVLGGVADASKPAHVSYGYGSDLSLDDGGGHVELRCKGQVVDAIDYAAATAGVAAELDGSQAPDAARNDDLASFCAATHEFAAGSFGTPRESNRFCSITAPATCNDGGAERDVVHPAVGDLVISEVMPDPLVAEDVDGQWFELLALADFDLNGVHAGTEVGSPRSQLDSPDCVPLSAGQHVLISRGADPAQNGGLPDNGGTFTFRLPLADGLLAVGVGDETLDEITWATAPEGASLSLGIRNNDPVANDAATAFCPGIVDYNGTDLGTPGAVNDFCVLASECIDGGTLMPRDRVVPGAGDISIVEWMANPAAAAGDDNTGEYIEVRFEVAADANGFELGSDVGVVTSRIDERGCVAKNPGDLLLFVRDLDPAQNGGIDNADGLTGFGMLNGGDRIFAGFDGVELDVIADTGNANADAGPGDEGVSAQIDPGGTLCDTPMGNTYGDGDRGTPGTPNPDC